MTRRQPADFTDYDLRLLRVFDAVVRGGGFATAEVMLNKSKSAISIDISSLETRLGVTLCQRGRSGFALTPYGKEIHAISQELFNQLRDFRERVHRITTVVSGELSVVVDTNIPLDFREEFIEVLSAFHEIHQDVYLKLDSASSEQVMKRVLEGAADLGISAVPRNYPETEIIPLLQEKMTLYCGSGHPLFETSQSDLTVDQLAEYDCIRLSTHQHETSRHIMERLNFTATAGTMETCLLLILTGDFIGFLPERSVQSYIETNQIRAILRDKLSFVDRCVAFVLRDLPKSLACQSFEEALKKAFAAYNAPGNTT